MIGQVNVDSPKGSFDGALNSYTVASNDQLTDAKDYQALILTQKNGVPIKLSSLGKVIEGVENTRVAGWSGTNKAVLVIILKQADANIIETVGRIRAVLPELKRWLPLALAGTFALMYLLHYSLDNLSLMAITISVGFVVDDAIVVIENVVRYIEHGDRPFEAAIKGARQIGFTVVSMSLSLVAVFIPLLFMGGLVGRLFHEFAVTLSAAILVSGVISLTLTPMMCARFLRHETPGAHRQSWV